MGATPFHYTILKVRLSKHFDKPTDMRYDGTQDLQEHLTAFEARMNLEGMCDEVRCHAFPVTLAGPAIRWFNALPQGSMTTFVDITRGFLAQFTTRIAKAKHPINLLGVTQRSGEPTRKYLDRFNNKCLEIDGLTDSVANLYLTNRLLNEDFRKHLTTKPVWIMQEIQNVEREYINDEEVNQVVAANKRQPAYHPARQPGNRERPKEHSKDGGPTKPFKPFPRAIREGKLVEFSLFIREPKRRERDRSNDDRSRVVKPGHEPEEDNDRGLTIVNVVVKRDAAPRSKLAAKKDTKILAVSSASHAPCPKRVPTISFRPKDQWFHDVPENLPMVITARVGTGLVKRILVDTGADSNIMFRNVFDALSLQEADLITHQHGMVGLGDNFIKPDGTISLLVSIG
ncbi:uncharacterized protein LOC107480562 [Arachis duranensis]|uniref:Uncharacterized protein LOC107480562 n=1 Tax=Arachis duranensis TaxID=130453 RepID=A0A6P4CXT2_ARADU|nr:uncharacterized protein LOC107480562 [Arachis duranensis]